MKIILAHDEAVSLRTFLIATVFRYFDLSEMEVLSDYSSPDILGLAIKIDKIIDQRSEKYEIPVSADELWVIRECVVHGLMGLSTYTRNREVIDYNGCNFEELARRLLIFANKANNVGQG